MAYASWTKILNDSALQRSSHSLSVVDYKAYIFGGELIPRHPVNGDMISIEVKPDGAAELSPILRSSTTGPEPRVGASSTALRGRIFIFSGRGGIAMAPIEEKGSFWVFDVSDKSWNVLQPKDPQLAYPCGRSYHAMTNDGINTLYLHAGCPEKGRLNDLWAFKVHERQWHELAQAPGQERGGTSVAFAEDKIFRMNGFDGNQELGGTIDVFNIATAVWETISYPHDGVSGPSSRSVSCLLALNIGGRSSLVTMFGEQDPSKLGHSGAGKMLGDVWMYDIQNGTWREIRPHAKDIMPASRGWFDADVVSSGLHPSLVVHGGLGESNERKSDIWLLKF